MHRVPLGNDWKAWVGFVFMVVAIVRAVIAFIDWWKQNTI